LETSLESEQAEPLSTEASTSLFNGLRQQYFETLYLSKTSLAYFAKGPLARARALVQNQESVKMRESLTEFYRESILPPKKMDLKYKESISKRIESLSHGGLQGSTNAQVPVTRRKKTGQKAKLDKDGLYSDEEEHLYRWWQEREISNVADLSMEARDLEKQTMISDLRTRETEMQLLLVLEILTLETLNSTPANSGMMKDATIKTEPDDGSDPVGLARPPRKVKNKRDLASDLDTMIDKLCIWHAVGIDQMLISPDKAGIDGKNRSSRVKDKLRDFCADVIIPFYASRLPERCKMICRRLGGPDACPARPQAVLTKSSGTSRLPPGTIIKSRPRVVPKRTLERVLSEDRGMRHASPPILSRSSTTSLLPNSKREMSESLQRPASRGGMHKSVSFTNREIDLVADAKAHEAKRKKLALLAAQKQELDAAIEALKKPNRTKVAQGIMDDLERRGGDTKSSNRPELRVQITATPKRPTAKDHWPKGNALSSTPTAEVPVEIIPSSTLRSRLSAAAPSGIRSSTTKRAVLSTIQQTTSRGLFAPLPVPQRFNTEADASISRDGAEVIHATPATNRLRLDININQVEATPLRMTTSQRPVMLTPLKRADVRIEDVFRDAPVISEQAGKAMDRVMGGGRGLEASIYDSLGWNDDFE